MSRLILTSTYIYDIFDSKDEEEKVHELDTKFGRKKDAGYVWSVSEKFFDEIIQFVDEKNIQLNCSFDFIKARVARVELFGFKQDNLPFFILAMKLQLKHECLSNENLFRDIFVITNPFRQYFSTLRGLTKKACGENQPCPMVTFFGIANENKEFEELYSECVNLKNLNQHQDILPDLIKASIPIRNAFPFNQSSFKHTQLSLCSMSKDHEVITAWGEFQGWSVGIGDIFLSSYMAVVTTKPENLIIHEKLIPTITPSDYEMLWLPDNGIGTIIYFTSLLVWSKYQSRKRKEIDEKLSILSSSMKDLKFENTEKIRDIISELNDIGMSLARFISNVGKLERDIVPHFSDYVLGQTSYVKETAVFPENQTNISDWIFPIKNIKTKTKGAYLHALAVLIQTKVEELEKGLAEVDKEHSRLRSSVNNIMRFREQTEYQNIQKALKKNSDYSLRATITMVTLTVILAVLTGMLVLDGQSTSDIISELKRSNELILASLYSDYEMELEYKIRPFDTPEKRDGFVHDMIVRNYGDFDAYVNTKWYLNEQYCTEDGVLAHKKDRKNLITEGFQKTNIIERKNHQNYNLNIPKLYGNYTNHMPFIFEIWVKAMPVTPDKEPIEYFTKEAIARVQYNYDPELDLWVPKQGWEKLDCNSLPAKNEYDLILDTTNNNQFRVR